MDAAALRHRCGLICFALLMTLPFVGSDVWAGSVIVGCSLAAGRWGYPYTAKPRKEFQ